MKNLELLAPAGNFEKLKTAIHYGADAVYLGISDFSLRAKSDNFNIDELKDAVHYTKKQDKKAYITLNIFPHNRDLPKIKDHIAALNEIQPDALIVSDLGVFDIVANSSNLPVHVSTQANVTNYESAKFWQRLGAKRLVLSRELSIDEIKEIRDKVTVELECFVHGAICISYSGRCYISSLLTNRSANKGECTNSCRWNYVLMEQKRPGKYLEVYENDRGTYVMSSRDLCMLGHIDKLYEAGVDSFKLEGRMKGMNYVAGVVKIYREAIDYMFSHEHYRVNDRWLRELNMLSSRGYTTGMFLGKQPSGDYNHDDEVMYRKTHALVGVVEDVQNGKALVNLRNTLKLGETVEYISKVVEESMVEIVNITDIENIPVDNAKNSDIVWVNAPKGIMVNDIIRRSVE